MLVTVNTWGCNSKLKKTWDVFCRWEKAYSGRNIGWSLRLCGTKLWTRPFNLPFNILALVNGRERDMDGYQHYVCSKTFHKTIVPPVSLLIAGYSFQLSLNTLVFLFSLLFLSRVLLCLLRISFGLLFWLVWLNDCCDSSFLPLVLC